MEQFSFPFQGQTLKWLLFFSSYGFWGILIYMENVVNSTIYKLNLLSMKLRCLSLAGSGPMVLFRLFWKKKNVLGSANPFPPDRLLIFKPLCTSREMQAVCFQPIFPSVTKAVVKELLKVWTALFSGQEVALLSCEPALISKDLRKGQRPQSSRIPTEKECLL